MLFKLSSTTTQLHRHHVCLCMYAVYFHLYNCRRLQPLFWGGGSMKWSTGWNNLARTLRSSRKQLCAGGHFEWAHQNCEQAFNGFLTLAITEKERGYCGLKRNWPDETYSDGVVLLLYYCTHKYPPTPASPDKCTSVLLNDNKAASSSTKTVLFETLWRPQCMK